MKKEYIKPLINEETICIANTFLTGSIAIETATSSFEDREEELDLNAKRFDVWEE